MDVVIKLFVLSQIRAVVTGIERITPALMQKVYQDELKPIHPMIDALRSGDATRIAMYSDLTIPDIDKRILELSQVIRAKPESIEAQAMYRGNEQAIRLHNMLVDMGYMSDLLQPLITRAFEDHPNMMLKDLMPIILSWYGNAENSKPDKPSKNKIKTIKQDDWHKLDAGDLRFIFSQSSNDEDLQQGLNRERLLFNTETWINSFG
jgi:hypothetical protein